MTVERLSPLDLMTRLVSFPTVSRDTNRPLIDWVAAYLSDHGIEHHIWVDPEQPEKAGLYAHVGPRIAGGLVLSGHTDVVPVDGQDWSSDPFVVEEREGKYFGRGCADMKGFDALALWALVEGHYRDLKRPLQLAYTFDEEIGCTGAPPLIVEMQKHLPKAEAVIVGEPSMLKAVTGHKGGAGFATRIVGHEVHSSLMHQGVSAIMEGARLIDWANQRNAENRSKPATDLAAMFTPPWTTCHVGMVSGGTAHNITAGECRFWMDFRVVPGETLAQWEANYRAEVAQVEAAMQAVHPDTRIEVEKVFDVPGLVPEEDGAAETLVRSLTGDNGRHVVSYGTEAGQFQQAGYSAVICGPGDIAQAHQADEFITVAQFQAGHHLMRDLLDRLAR
ncbi:acetylornithine deacetylase [Tritonibacter horizontis]|uniref:Acetylornithine deacetylase n=1 Tax=Tritonibacter horizontis TaxID=1768241 RepID=A0A132C121_9RHOB|nr:acetylornithine deacetylase [Tritonibacter horizontis]KUP93807.1 acetylornithine deacetylase [Tritonibacter horizontis]